MSRECNHAAFVLLRVAYSLSVLGNCSRIPQTGLLKNDGNLFLTDLEAGKSKIEVPARSVPGEGFLMASSLGGRGEGSL